MKEEQPSLEFPSSPPEASPYFQLRTVSPQKTTPPTTSKDLPLTEFLSTTPNHLSPDQILFASDVTPSFDCGFEEHQNASSSPSYTRKSTNFPIIQRYPQIHPHIKPQPHFSPRLISLLQAHILRTQAKKVLTQEEIQKWARARFFAAGSAVLGVSMLGSLLMINSKYLLTRHPDLKIGGWILFGSVVGGLQIYRLRRKEEKICRGLKEKYFADAEAQEVYATADYFGMKKSLMWMEAQSRKETSEGKKK